MTSLQPAPCLVLHFPSRKGDYIYASTHAHVYTHTHSDRHDQVRRWTNSQLRSPGSHKPKTWQKGITDLETSHPHVPGRVEITQRNWWHTSCCGANQSTWPIKTGTKNPEAVWGCSSSGSKDSREKHPSNPLRVCLPNLRCSQPQQMDQTALQSERPVLRIRVMKDALVDMCVGSMNISP